MTPATFPSQHLPTDVQDQVRRIAAYDGVPETLPALAALAGASMAIGRGFDYAIDDKGAPITSNLWITPVAPPSTGKSSLNYFLRVLQDAYDEEMDDWKMERKPELVAELEKLESDAAEAKKAKEWNNLKTINKLIAEKTAQIRSGRPVWKVENFTVEALTSAFSADGRVPYVCVVASEGRAVADNLLSSYADKSTEAFWLAGWNRTDTVMRTRKGFEDSDADGTVKGLQISAMFALQPDKNEQFMKPPFSTSGFAQRRLFCTVEPGKLVEPSEAKELAEAAGISRPDLTRWNAWVRSMLSTTFVREGKRCKPTREALLLLREFYNSINEAIDAGRLAALEGHARRWGEMASKLSLVLHCMQHGPRSAEVEIDTDSVKGGIEIMKWFAGEMKAGYWEVVTKAAEDTLTKLEKFAATRGIGGFTLRDLVRAGIGTRQDLKTLVDGLERQGKLLQVMQPHTPGAGRPKADRWVLPKYKQQEEAA